MSELGKLVREVALLKRDIERLSEGWKVRDAEIERLRAALKEIQAYSVGDPKPRHTWYYDRAQLALDT